MTLPNILIPMPVVLPLAVGAVVLALGELLPKRVPEALGIAAALAVAVLSAALSHGALDGTPVHWFGGWEARPGVTAGLALVRDRLPRALAASGAAPLKPLFEGLNRLHSGVVDGDVVPLALGIAMLAGWATF